MAATYPASVRLFTPHVNLSEVIDADHVNALQDEISAIETTIGQAPQLDSLLNPSPHGGPYNFVTVKARLDALARGATDPVCYASRNATQSIPAGAFTLLSWDTVLIDPNSMYVAPYRVQIYRTGWLQRHAERPVQLDVQRGSVLRAAERERHEHRARRGRPEVDEHPGHQPERHLGGENQLR